MHEIGPAQRRVFYAITPVICLVSGPADDLVLQTKYNLCMTQTASSLAIKTKGRWTVGPEAHPLVRRLRSNGCSQATIAAAIGVPPSTFRDLLDRDDDLKAAYEEGHGAMHDELVGLLMEQARSGNVASAIFLLKGSHGYREHTPVQPADKPPPVNIVIPPSLSPTDLANLTSQLRNITPDDPDNKPVARKRKGIER